jgi:hypothetical protein
VIWLVLLLVAGATEASAVDVSGGQTQTVGREKLKIKGIGSQKDFIGMDVVFGADGPGTFSATDDHGTRRTGTFSQRGKKIVFRLSAAGVASAEDDLGDWASAMADRQARVRITSVKLTGKLNRRGTRIKLKGKVKGIGTDNGGNSAPVRWTFKTNGAVVLAVSPGPGPGPEPGGSSVKKWTYMVYMGADNNLSLAGLYDLNEMEAVGSTSDVNVVLQAEFSQIYTPGITSDTLRFLVRRDNDDGDVDLEAGSSIGNVDMGDPAALTSFIQWAALNYPAEHYALVIWDHGAGWKLESAQVTRAVFRGAVQDETSDSFMSLPDLAGAVSSAGVHLDIVNFDACLMAMYEVAYEFGGLVDYMVFSEELEPGEGDPYDQILAELTADPSMSAERLSGVIVDEYDAFYAVNNRGATTKSAIDMSQIGALDQALLELADALLADPHSALVVRDAQEYSQDYEYTANHDIHDFARYLVDSDLADDGPVVASARRVMTVMEAMVVANATNPNADVDANRGLAIYIPTASETTDEELDDYAELACNQARASGLGTWGAYVEALIEQDGAATYGEGGFAIRVWWADPSGGSCDADVDLWVWEPDADYFSSGQGAWYQAYNTPVTANGQFSPDSSQSGDSFEIYYANDQVYWGDYSFAVNLYSSSCADVLVHLEIRVGEGQWIELNGFNFPELGLEYPSPQLMNFDYWVSGSCFGSYCNAYSNWWIPDVHWQARASREGMLSEGGEPAAVENSKASGSSIANREQPAVEGVS